MVVAHFIVIDRMPNLLVAAAVGAKSAWMLTVIGVIGLALLGLACSSYRFLVGYFAAGMGYWLGIEAIHWLLCACFAKLSTTHGYLLAVGLSLLPIMGWLHLHSAATNPTPAARKSAATGFFARRFSLRMLAKQSIALSRPLNQALNRVGKKSILPSRSRQPEPVWTQKKVGFSKQDTDFYQHYVRHSSVTER